jgi:hypothetical protein
VDELARSVRSLLEQLLVVFVVLKLAGLVAWSWLWVLAPLWVPLWFLAMALAARLGVRLMYRWESRRG